MHSRNSAYELPSWLWLWLPLAIFGVSLAIKILDQGIYYKWVIGEQGFIENGSLVLLAVAIVYGIRIVLLQAPDPAPTWIRWWVLLIALGSIYFFGEEASWGQHLFGWSPSDGWRDLNQQDETNLHNVEGILGVVFDQVPRNLLTAAAVVGGIIVPLYRRIRSLEWGPDQFHYWLWPTIVCTPAALLGVFVSVPQKPFKVVGAPLPDLFVGLNPGELKECFLAFFIMLYLVSLAVRIDREKKKPLSSRILKDE